MTEITGNIWDFKSPRTPICITTNGFVKANGECVMGRGVALQAKQRYPKLPIQLGTRIKQFGNKTFYFPDYDLITLPVKHNWFEAADPILITNSCLQLVEMAKGEYIELWEKVYLVRPGCSNGRLTWDIVKPLIEPILDSENYVVVQN